MAVRRQTWRSSSTTYSWRERPRQSKLINHVPVALLTGPGEEPCCGCSGSDCRLVDWHLLGADGLRLLPRGVSCQRQPVGQTRQRAPSDLETPRPPLGRRGTAFFGSCSSPGNPAWEVCNSAETSATTSEVFRLRGVFAEAHHSVVEASSPPQMSSSSDPRPRGRMWGKT